MTVLQNFHQPFSQLSPHQQPQLWQNFDNLISINKKQSIFESYPFNLPKTNQNTSKSINNGDYDKDDDDTQDNEAQATQWLMEVFDTTFADQNVVLVHASSLGKSEPEYLPAVGNEPAKICFAHGYFSSALHEISHWCIAGRRRRLLNDFGYWYAPDGRTQEQQNQFEQVEIKPQAIECLLSLACGQDFRVSQDNLNASFDNSSSTFAQDVYQQAHAYLYQPSRLPEDAKNLISVLYHFSKLTYQGKRAKSYKTSEVV